MRKIRIFTYKYAFGEEKVRPGFQVGNQVYVLTKAYQLNPLLKLDKSRFHYNGNTPEQVPELSYLVIASDEVQKAGKMPKGYVLFSDEELDLLGIPHTHTQLFNNLIINY